MVAHPAPQRRRPREQFLTNATVRLLARLASVLGTLVAVFLWRAEEPGYGPVFWAWVTCLSAYVASFPANKQEGAQNLGFYIRLVLLLVFAAVWRIPQVYEMPANISVDELLPGVESLHIAAGEAPNVFGSVGWFSIPRLAFTPGALFMAWLPLPPFHSLRLASVCTGLVGIAATVGLGRELISTRAGWLGGMFMAVAYWHVHNSRTGFPFAQSSLATAAVAFLLLRALRRADLRSLALAGLACGFCLHLYFPARAVLLIVPLVFLHGALRFRLSLRAALRAGLVFSTAAALAFLPLAANAGLGAWAERSRSITILFPATLHSREVFWQVEGWWAVLVRQTSEALRMFSQWADLAVLHRSPAGLLDPVLLVLVLLGAVIGILQANGAALLLCTWFLLVFFLGVVMTDAPRASYRLAPAMPALLLLAAFALDHLWASTGPSRNRAHRSVRAVVLLGILIAVASLNYWLFFQRYPRGDGEQVTMSEAVRFASHQCSERQFWIVPAWASWDQEILPLFCDDLRPARPELLAEVVGNHKPVTLLLVNDFGRRQQQVQRLFPQARVRLHAAKDGRLLFISAEISRADWEQASERALRYLNSDS